MKDYERSQAGSKTSDVESPRGGGEQSLRQRAMLQRRYAASKAATNAPKAVMRSAAEDYGPPAPTGEEEQASGEQANGEPAGDAEAAQEGAPIGTVHSIDGVNIRATPEKNDTNILDTLDRGQEAPVYDQEGYWYEIEHQGQPAYVTTMTSAVDFSPVAGVPEEEIPAPGGGVADPVPRDPATGEPTTGEPAYGAPDNDGPQLGAPDEEAPGNEAPGNEAPGNEAPETGGGWDNGGGSNGALDELLAQEILDVTEIAQARELIEALPPAQQSEKFLLLQKKVEYANQRDNESDQETEDGGTCAFTSISMAMKMLGVANPQPDKQFEDVLVELAGSGDITQAAVWANVAEGLGVGMDTVVADRRQVQREEWEAIRDNHLAKGQGVIVSLWGHVVRLQEVNSAGLVVDDPYGESTIKESVRRDRTDDNGNVIAEDSKYNWEGSNSTEEGEGDNKGEDVSYTWEDVDTYTFGGVYAFSV